MKETATELTSPKWVAFALILLLTGLLWYRYPLAVYRGQDQVPSEYALTLKAWQAAKAGENPYELKSERPIGEEEVRFKHSPGTLTLVGLMPKEPRTSWFVMGTLSLLVFGLSLAAGARYPSWRSVIYLILGWSLAWRGLLETLETGQLEILIFGLAVFAGILLRRQPLICGLIAGTLPWIKLPWMLLLLPLMLVNVATLQGKGKKVRRVRLVFSGYFFSWFIWGAGVPSLVFGQEEARAITSNWIHAMISQPTDLYFSRVNQSVWSAGMRILGDDPYLGLGIGTTLAGILLGSLMVKGMRMLPNRDVLAWLAPWLLVTQLLSPLSWRAGSVFALAAPFAIGITPESRIGLRWFLKTSAFVLMIVQINPIVLALVGKSWTALQEYGVFTAFWGVLLLLCL